MEQAIIIKGIVKDTRNITLEEEINIPNGQKVEIIIKTSVEKDSFEPANNILEEVIHIFEQYKDIYPYREITDPVEWQKNIRSEWER
ncbi:MAG: hypothetical protein H7A25_16715 [Leptospiraceae bacterium]|nr:hypothetical protein [Leptospiraceae bacterium]